MSVSKKTSGKRPTIKMLYLSNISGTTAVSSFSKASVIAARDLGNEFHLAANMNKALFEAREQDERSYGIKTHHIDFIRTPYDPRNIRAYRQVVNLIRKEKIDVIHCNTPIGGFVGRLAGKKCGVKKVIYQAHGFHFYKGAPLINWLLYYPIERWLGHYTDDLITINREDYERAQKFHLRNHGEVHYVPGVGIDLSAFKDCIENRLQKRTELGVTEKDIILISVGELNSNKNHKVILEAMGKLNNTSIQYFICGVGNQEAKLKGLVKKYKIESQVHFLGYRNDIKELLMSADIFVMPSYREGLSRAIMEAMACGMPCIVSNIRGNTDLIVDRKGGFLCNPRRSQDFAAAISSLTHSRAMMKEFGEFNRERIKLFDIRTVVEDIKTVYGS